MLNTFWDQYSIGHTTFKMSMFTLSEVFGFTFLTHLGFREQIVVIFQRQ